MPVESKEAGQDPVDSFTDDLIREFFADAGQSGKSAGRDRGAMAALLEAAMGSSSRASSGPSIVERFLVAQVMASELADALAPALAEALAPEIMKALEHYPADGARPKEPAAATTRARKSETR